MKHFYFARIFLILTLSGTALFASLNSKSAIVYYGDNISYSLFGIHDYIILDPDQVDTYRSGFNRYKKSIYAYISVNEALDSRWFAKDIKSSWVIGENSAWGSKLLNISNIEYQDFLLDRVIKRAYKRGFRNFFFDTLDSYQLAKLSKEDKELLRLALVNFIKRFKKRYPYSKLIINRGFELIDDIHPYIDALLFESYYRGLDLQNGGYKHVSNSDREWLDIQLNRVREYKIPIIALDYLPSGSKSEQIEVVKSLKQRGFIPYVSTKELRSVGLSSKSAIKREVLILYNSQKLEDNLVNFSYAHRLASMPLEYLGYIPILRDVNLPLLKEDLSSRYAGVIIWLDGFYSEYDKLIKWVKDITEDGVKVLFLGDASLDLNSPILSDLGIHVESNFADKRGRVKSVINSDIFGFEIEPSISYQEEIIVPEAIKRLYSYKNREGQISTLAAVMPWGGYVRDDLLVSYIYGDNLWVVDPFKLFKSLLDLKDIPVPDTTTENGKRLMFVHIDGDGSMNRVENNVSQLSIELILEDFIKAYKFPQSVSIVEAETALHGLYPKLSTRLEKAAKDIFKLPHIEPATHTYSHPFYWQKLQKEPSNKKYNIAIKGYSFSIDREIGGSLKYINRNLLPKDSQKAKMIFWTGDCAPSEDVLRYTYSNKIININGGDTIITNDRPWLSLIQPLGLRVGKYYQIYTAQQNENVFTNDWKGPFWGFKKVIQTFKLTDKPRRVKPVNIYYHFYSASKRASYVALKDIYDWTLKRDLNHIFTSEYPPKVTDFYNVSLANSGDRWLLKGFYDLRTVRVKKSMGYPILRDSIGVAGYKDEGSYSYVHLDGRKNKILTLVDKREDEGYLVESNAKLISLRNGELVLKSHMPISITFKLKNGCRLATTDKGYTFSELDNGVIELKFQDKKRINVKQKCDK